MGVNIKAPLKHSISHGAAIHWRELNLHHLKNNCVVIVTDLTSIRSLVGSGEVILINSLERSNVGRAFNQKSI